MDSLKRIKETNEEIRVNNQKTKSKKIKKNILIM